MQIKAISREQVEKNIVEFIELLKEWKYVHWKKENFLFELPKKWDFSFALYENDQLKGFCFASNKIKEAYYIHLLFVSEQVRGRSAGANMIQQAKKIALQHNIHTIELRCPESNKRAIDFYLSNEFKIVDKVRDEVSGPEADFYLQLKF